MKKNISAENKFARKRHRKPVLPVISIVCEGDTEYEYFRSIRSELRFKNVNVKIHSAPMGSDPKSLIKCCEKQRGRDDFEEVYCVFDSDDRKYVEDVINAAKRSKIDVIFSNPCFEFWFILHYVFTTRSFSADEALVELKRHLPGYEKNSKLTYSEIEDMQPQAIKNAEKVIAEQSKNDPTLVNEIIVDRSVTYAHKLVTRLLSLKP